MIANFSWLEWLFLWAMLVTVAVAGMELFDMFFDDDRRNK